MPVPVTEILVGVYLGLLAGLFPAFIAFAIGFGFRYFTEVTVPGLGVVVLGGALAGISGGLMGLVDPSLAESWTGITAVLVILMLCLWAHSQGDKLAVATPRRLTLSSLASARVSENLTDLVDAYGQLRIRPTGEVQDMEGYPPLPDELRAELKAGTWRFPAKLSLAELEDRLEERLLADHDLADVSVAIDRKGRAEITAAPTVAGLSRRVPEDKLAVSVGTLLPSGMARGDTATIQLPGGDVTGPVLSAHTEQADPATQRARSEGDAPAEETDDEEAPPAASPTTGGGEGRVTVAASPGEAERLLRTGRASMFVRSRGKQREYEVVRILRKSRNRFRKVRLSDDSPLVGQTLGASRLRRTYGVGVLAIRRPSERIIAPPGTTRLQAGDVLIVVGKPAGLDELAEVTEPA